MVKLRRAPEARVGELELGVRRALVLSLVATIKTLNEQIKQLERQIATAIREHPDGPIFLSLFKKPNSVITAAELLAEIGDCRGRYPTRDTLAADAGQAAVAVESGKRKAACFRWACNKRLRQAFVTLADTSRHHNPWAQDLYAAASARGHDHPRAIRTVGRGWCRIVWRCWQDGVPYDPARHRALQRHVTVTIPTSSGPRPDTAATQRMAGAAVTQRAARRAERNALDGKPTSAIASGVERSHGRTRQVGGGSRHPYGDVPNAVIHPRGCAARVASARTAFDGAVLLSGDGAVRNAGSWMGESVDGLTRRCWRCFLVLRRVGSCRSRLTRRLRGSRGWRLLQQPGHGERDYLGSAAVAVVGRDQAAGYQ